MPVDAGGGCPLAGRLEVFCWRGLLESVCLRERSDGGGEVVCAGSSWLQEVYLAGGEGVREGEQGQ